jgi:hypothetical protein
MKKNTEKKIDDQEISIKQLGREIAKVLEKFSILPPDQQKKFLKTFDQIIQDTKKAEVKQILMDLKALFLRRVAK